MPKKLKRKRKPLRADKDYEQALKNAIEALKEAAEKQVMDQFFADLEADACLVMLDGGKGVAFSMEEGLTPPYPKNIIEKTWQELFDWVDYGPHSAAQYEECLENIEKARKELKAVQDFFDETEKRFRSALGTGRSQGSGSE